MTDQQEPALGHSVYNYQELEDPQNNRILTHLLAVLAVALRVLLADPLLDGIDVVRLLLHLHHLAQPLQQLVRRAQQRLEPARFLLSATRARYASWSSFLRACTRSRSARVALRQGVGMR